jgi:carotenoid cleavage dioxygenase-like enzyme
VHSFGVTDKSIVFFLAELAFDAHGFQSKGKSVLEAVTQGAGNKLIELARYTGRATVTEVPRSFVTHVINSYSTPNGAEVDYFATNEVGENMSYRFSPMFATELLAWRLRGGARAPAQLDLLGEFPVINPNVDGMWNRYFYYCGSSQAGEQMDSWVKFDRVSGLKKACASPGALHTEAVFIPACNACSEDEGYLLGVVLVGRQTYLKAVDARSMEQIGIVPLEGVNPTGIHSLWLGG